MQVNLLIGCNSSSTAVSNKDHVMPDKKEYYHIMMHIELNNTCSEVAVDLWQWAENSYTYICTS